MHQDDNDLGHHVQISVVNGTHKQVSTSCCLILFSFALATLPVIIANLFASVQRLSQSSQQPVQAAAQMHPKPQLVRLSQIANLKVLSGAESGQSSQQWMLACPSGSSQTCSSA